MPSNVRKKLFVLAKVLSSGVLLVLIFKKAGIQRVLSELGSVDLRYLFLAAVVHVVVVGLAGLRWSLLLEDRLPISRVLSLYFIGSFFNNLLPGAVGGDAVKIYYLYQDTRKGGSVFGSVLLDRLIGLFTLLAIGLIADVFAFSELGSVGMQWVVPALFAAFLLGCMVLFRFKIGGRIGVVADFYDYSRKLFQRKRILTRAFLLSLALQTLTLCSIYLAARGIGQHLTFPALFIFVPVILTVTALPISISGLGVREGAFVVLFGLLGTPPQVSASISLLWYFSIAAGSIVGAVEYARFRNRR